MQHLPNRNSNNEARFNPTATLTATPPGLRLQVALRAYHLWLQDGARYDNRLIHWLRAEREVTNGYPQR
jgi:hypothetical protein